MKKFLVNAAVAAVIGLTGLAGAATTASAESLIFQFGSPRGVDVQYRDYDRYDRYSDEGDWRRDRPRWGGERRGRCDRWLAVEKARDLGLRRAHVANVARRKVIVEGRRHGYREAIIFANVRGCPVIGRW
ncbi:hypothetical protein PZN02_002396 [Sinorhizobium garamanticum]|uniref:Uncharacterized protein n=1 Tax=Sinorhizobium garamanticum TaxID=680247 RepID=A0ABY8D8D4_9HYPH|nr:hypothetical protein [Sinorhizobium garamanticum]WEX86138.1 hypothetical protein PZN02_002396 [Sinorhizobium garamanticum]